MAPAGLPRARTRHSRMRRERMQVVVGLYRTSPALRRPWMTIRAGIERERISLVAPRTEPQPRREEGSPSRRSRAPRPRAGYRRGIGAVLGGGLGLLVGVVSVVATGVDRSPRVRSSACWRAPAWGWGGGHCRRPGEPGRPRGGGARLSDGRPGGRHARGGRGRGRHGGRGRHSPPRAWPRGCSHLHPRARARGRCPRHPRAPGPRRGRLEPRRTPSSGTLR